MSISSLVLELWQFSFIKDWPEIRKSETPPSEFCPISGDWGELWIPNLVRMSLIECYCMLQNSRVTAFTVFELLRENQLGEYPIPPPRLGLSNSFFNSFMKMKNEKRTVFRFPLFYENEKRIRVLKIQSKILLNMKMAVKYLNFVVHIGVCCKFHCRQRRI